MPANKQSRSSGVNRTPGRKNAEFTEKTKRTLATEAGYLCANPSCLAPTFAAGSTADQTGKVGQAAHISAAAQGGPRWQPGMDPEDRKSAKNGIWLCSLHAGEVDVDESRHTMALLHTWKRRAKARALEARGKQKHWVPSRKFHLIRTSRSTKMPIARHQLDEFIGVFLEDIGGNALWNEEKLECLHMALYETSLNAMEHGSATFLNLRSRGYRIDLVHDGSDFNPTTLVAAQGNGGSESMKYLTDLFGNDLSLSYKYNGKIATFQMIDVSVAGPQHPCAVPLEQNWADTYKSTVESCNVVHLFPVRRLSFSDGTEVGIAPESAHLNTSYVLHDTNPRVVEYFRKAFPSLRAPGEAS